MYNALFTNNKAMSPGTIHVIFYLYSLESILSPKRLISIISISYILQTMHQESMKR